MITAHTTVAEGVRFAEMIDAPATLKVRIKNKIGIAIFAVGDDAVLVEKILTEMRKGTGDAEGKAAGEATGKAASKAEGKAKRAGAGDSGSA